MGNRKAEDDGDYDNDMTMWKQKEEKVDML